jgi:diguanylate cyclase (GGDEF)-like protein
MGIEDGILSSPKKERKNKGENILDLRKKEKKAAKEFFEKEYDNDSGQVDSKEDYVEKELIQAELDELKNLKMRSEAELTEADCLIEESNTLTEDQIEKRKKEVGEWKEKWRQDRIDDVTGLQIRKVLFEKMNKKIKEIYSFDDNATNEEIFQALTTKDVSELENVNFSVMMADVSFLSLVNEAGHEQGDSLLAEISDEIKKEVEDSFRHGGDEITGFFDMFGVDDKSIEEKIKKMKESISNIPIDKIKQYKLKPNLDVGVAGFTEALQVFRALAKNSDCRDKLKDNPVKKIENIMVAIADKRSFIEKGKERIALLAEKYDDKKLYKEIISFLRKGGHGISDKNVKKIANLAKGSLSTRVVNFFKKLGSGKTHEPIGTEGAKVEKSIQQAVLKFISEKEKIELGKKSKSEDQYSYFESKAIMDVIEIA